MSPISKAQIFPKGQAWFAQQGWKAFPFQKAAWKAYADGKSGIVNAPTGSGKTYSLLVPIILQAQEDGEDNKGLKAIWLTPIRALAKEIEMSAKRFLEENEIPWNVGLRTGDTPAAERQRQKRKPPQILITTPESLHLLLAQKDSRKFFKSLQCVVADEWHELVGNKRGVQVELALSRLRAYCPALRTWGISATIGNLQQAMEVLMGANVQDGMLIKSKIKKRIQLLSVLPEEVERFPWAGHLGISLLDQVLKIVHSHESTLIFTNTRAQSEIWYHRLLEADPSVAGIMAMHHGSISRDLRTWVEESLYQGKLKAVVCTSSLDLGVDFRPVDAIVQIGGPKGIAKFVQRAGRSGHQPGAKSKIWFLPTNSLELLEAAALREAIDSNYVENRLPLVRCFDVLVQFLVTLAVGDGFDETALFQQVTSTHAFASITREEWEWALRFIVSGGKSLDAYDEYKKVEILEGVYKVSNRRTAMRHRMSIGTIVSDQMLQVRFVTGGHIGSVEEWFVGRLKPGDVFWFAGRSLELVRIKDLVVQVKVSRKKKGIIPSWQGGRMSLTSHMSHMLRQKLNEAASGKHIDIELKTIAPLLAFQSQRSHLPNAHEFLIEQFQTKEGYHAVFYPFEGRSVHEGMASLLAYRMSLLKPITLSLAFNDYGFELLSDQQIDVQEALDNDLLSKEHLWTDLQAGVNSAELARRRFRDIAAISGLIFQGFPGAFVKEKHLQSSSGLIFDVFADYDPENLLLRQAFDEVIEYQLEFQRLVVALDRLSTQKTVMTFPQKPTPFAFPIMVDRLRGSLTSEKLKDRIEKMSLSFE